MCGIRGTPLNLKRHLDNLFNAVLDEDPEKYGEIVLMARKHSAKLTNGDETVIITIVRNNIRIRSMEDDKRKLPEGIFYKKAIINILDGHWSLNTAINMGFIDCVGTKSDIILFFKLLRILLIVSSKSPRIYNLWDEFK